MGRELRRKQAKKDGKSLEREELIDSHQVEKLIITTLVLIIVFSTVYLLSALFITKEVNWFRKDKDIVDTDSVDNSILASAIFKQVEDSYYVYFYDYDEKENKVTDVVNSKLVEQKVYRVNTNSAMNANYVGETGNKKAKSLEELKVISPTLIKIADGKIAEYYEGNEITNKLK